MAESWHVVAFSLKSRAEGMVKEKSQCLDMMWRDDHDQQYWVPGGRRWQLTDQVHEKENYGDQVRNEQWEGWKVGTSRQKGIITKKCAKCPSRGTSQKAGPPTPRSSPVSRPWRRVEPASPCFCFLPLLHIRHFCDPRRTSWSSAVAEEGVKQWRVRKGSGRICSESIFSHYQNFQKCWK